MIGTVPAADAPGPEETVVVCVCSFLVSLLLVRFLIPVTELSLSHGQRTQLIVCVVSEETMVTPAARTEMRIALLLTLLH